MRSSLLFKFCLFACVLAPACSAQDAAAAKTFLQSIYARYTKNSRGVEIAGPGARRFLHSSLIALIREDARAVGPGEVGVLDSDPLCGCQDWDGIFDLRIDMRQVKADHAEALVRFPSSKRRSRRIAVRW